METIENLSKKTKANLGFLSSVFSFDDDFKASFMNINQYIFLALIPIILLTKTIKRFTPDPDNEKGSFEILFEILAQLFFLFAGLFIINRIVVYIPTYSEVDYEIFPISSVLIGLMILFSFQTAIAEKMNILSERIEGLWNGEDTSNKKKKKGSSNVKVSQPISNQGQQPSYPQQNMILPPPSSVSMNGTTSINNLPQMSGGGGSPQQSNQNYNDFYANQENQLVGANSPGEGFNGGEILAANSVLGGSFGSSF